MRGAGFLLFSLTFWPGRLYNKLMVGIISKVMLNILGKKIYDIH